MHWAPSPRNAEAARDGEACSGFNSAAGGGRLRSGSECTITGPAVALAGPTTKGARCFSIQARARQFDLRLLDGVEDADRGHGVVRAIDDVIAHEAGNAEVIGTAPLTSRASASAIPGLAFT